MKIVLTLDDFVPFLRDKEGPVAQLDRALHYGCSGWGFESLQVHEFKEEWHFLVISIFESLLPFSSFYFKIGPHLVLPPLIHFLVYCRGAS